MMMMVMFRHFFSLRVWVISSWEAPLCACGLQEGAEPVFSCAGIGVRGAGRHRVRVRRRPAARPAASTIREVSLMRCFMVMSFSLEAKGSGILGLRLFNGC